MISGYILCLVIALKWIQRIVIDPVLNCIFQWTTLYGPRDRGKLFTHMPITDSAQLVRIWARGTYCKLLGHDLANFLYTHVSYVHPEMVISKTNVTLHSVTDSHAVFSMTPHHVDVYNFSRYKSVSVAQYEEATHMLLLPLWAFDRLMMTQHHQDDKAEGHKVVSVTTSGRSGSTLLVQMLAKLPHTRVVSEPWAFVLAHKCYQTERLTWKQYGCLVKNLVTFCTISSSSNPALLTVLKLPVYCTAMVAIMAEVCPSMKHVFSTRSPKPSIEVICKGLESPDYIFFHALVASQFWPDCLPFPYDSESEAIVKTRAWLQTENAKNKVRPISVYAGLTYTTSIMAYLKNREHYATEAVFHDDLIANPHDCLVSLCERLNIVPAEDTLLPFNREIVPVFAEDRGQEMMSGEDYELVKDVFFMLKVPFDLDTDKDRLLQILNRRRRKHGISRGLAPPPPSQPDLLIIQPHLKSTE